MIRKTGKQGIVFDIKHFAIHDGPGIRTTVFLKGCPLRCAWCHNPEGQHPRPEEISDLKWLRSQQFVSEPGLLGKQVSVEEVVREVIKDMPFFEESGGGVTISGGEPSAQPEFLFSLLREFKIHHLHIVLDTCGCVELEVIQRIHPLVDLFLYDLKLMDDIEQQKWTGISNRQILANLEWLAGQGKSVRVRVALIAGLTASRENIRMMLAWLKKFPALRQIDFLPCHAYAANKYLRLGRAMAEKDFSAPAAEEMTAICRLFQDNQFEVTIGG